MNSAEMLTAPEVEADPAMLRNPDVREKRRNRSGQGVSPGSPLVTGRPRNQIAENWVSYPRSMISSPAMRALSLSAIRAMHRLEEEHMDNGGAENGRLIVTHDQFIAWGIHRDSVSPAIRELVALGFVEITEKGAAGNENHRRAARYRLTYVNNSGRSQPSHEWKTIKTAEDADSIAAIARRAKDPRAAAAGRHKNKIPVTETMTGTGHGNHDRSAKSPVTETMTTRPVTETMTTIYTLPQREAVGLPPDLRMVA
jgi:hypothetical protein